MGEGTCDGHTRDGARRQRCRCARRATRGQRQPEPPVLRLRRRSFSQTFSSRASRGSASAVVGPVDPSLRGFYRPAPPQLLQARSLNCKRAEAQRCHHQSAAPGPAERRQPPPPQLTQRCCHSRSSCSRPMSTAAIIHAACRRGDAAAVRRLLMPAWERAEDGRLPLHTAAQQGSEAVVPGTGAPAAGCSTRGSYGSRCKGLAAPAPCSFEWPCGSGVLKVAPMAAIDAGPVGCVPLHCAPRHGHEGAVRLLAGGGASGGHGS